VVGSRATQRLELRSWRATDDDFFESAWLMHVVIRVDHGWHGAGEGSKSMAALVVRRLPVHPKPLSWRSRVRCLGKCAMWFIRHFLWPS
jgi:hypothetical protein